MFSLSSSNHLFSFSVPYSVNELYVDDPDKESGGKIEVSLNVSLPNLHCDCEYLRNIYIYTTLHTSSLYHTFCLCVFLFTLFMRSLYSSVFPFYQTLSYPIILHGILAKDK